MGHYQNTDELNPRAMTVPVAAYAAGVSADTIRNWLKGGAVRLLVPRSRPGAWLRCAPVDLVRLAIVGELVRFGFMLTEADNILASAIDPHVAGVALALGDIPWPILISRLYSHALTVSREPSGLAISYQTLTSRRTVPHTTAMLEVFVGRIAREVCGRVREAERGDFNLSPARRTATDGATMP